MMDRLYLKTYISLLLVVKHYSTLWFLWFLYNNYGFYTAIISTSIIWTNPPLNSTIAAIKNDFNQNIVHYTYCIYTRVGTLIVTS